MIEYSWYIFLGKSIVCVTHQQTSFAHSSIADHNTFQHLFSRSIERITVTASILKRFHCVLPTFRAERRHDSWTSPETISSTGSQVFVWPVETLELACRTLRWWIRQVKLGDPRFSSRFQNNPSPSTAVSWKLTVTPTTRTLYYIFLIRQRNRFKNCGLGLVPSFSKQLSTFALRGNASSVSGNHWFPCEFHIRQEWAGNNRGSVHSPLRQGTSAAQEGLAAFPKIWRNREGWQELGQGIFWQTVCQLRLAIGKANCGTPQLPTRDG